jgi:hypothetical protein
VSRAAWERLQDAGLSLTGASLYLLDAIERMSRAGSDFVYVRADPAPDHSRIP